MAGRRWQGAPPPRTGFQRHHLIPVGLLRRPQMAAMFDQLRADGFALHRFDRNGLVLPACESAALSSGPAPGSPANIARRWSSQAITRISRVVVFSDSQASPIRNSAVSSAPPSSPIRARAAAKAACASSASTMVST